MAALPFIVAEGSGAFGMFLLVSPANALADWLGGANYGPTRLIASAFNMVAILTLIDLVFQMVRAASNTSLPSLWPATVFSTCPNLTPPWYFSVRPLFLLPLFLSLPSFRRVSSPSSTASRNGR